MWIDDGEKYALVGLQVKLKGGRHRSGSRPISESSPIRHSTSRQNGGNGSAAFAPIRSKAATCSSSASWKRRRRVFWMVRTNRCNSVSGISTPGFCCRRCSRLPISRSC